MPTDPVCGMHVDEHKAAATAVYQGKPYYFCSSGCHESFSRDPTRYAEPKTASEPKPKN